MKTNQSERETQIEISLKKHQKAMLLLVGDINNITKEVMALITDLADISECWEKEA